MLQAANEHRLNWISGGTTVRVKVVGDSTKEVEWLNENIDALSWTTALHNNHTTIFFERSQDASKFRTVFSSGDSRTVDVG